MLFECSIFLTGVVNVAQNDYLCNMEKVLFVCLGNICRSPAAEEVMRHTARRHGLDLELDSAGTYGGHAGDRADARMRRAASVRGYDLTHRARRFTEGDFERFDRIVVMDDMNYETVHRMAPSREAADRIYRMREFFGESAVRWDHVPDPYYEGREGFELVLNLLEEACEGLALKIQAEAQTVHIV